MESKTKVYGKVIKNKWKIGDYISEGGNGSVYECEDLENPENSLAIKFEDLKSKSLIAEIKVYPKLKDLPGLPKIFGAGVFKDQRYLVMERLEPVEKISDTVVSQTLTILKTLSERGYSHNDVKIDNIMKRKNGEIVLIDLGLIRRLGENFGEPVQAVLCLMGLDAHLGIITPRNDVESLIYSMEDSLPWENETSYSKTFQMKKEFVKNHPVLSRLHGIDYEWIENTLIKNN